jgi:hypothetical protein
MTRVGGRLGKSDVAVGTKNLVIAYVGYGPFFAWAPVSFIFFLGMFAASFREGQGKILWLWLLYSAVLLPLFYIVGTFAALITGYLTSKAIQTRGACGVVQSSVFGGLCSVLVVALWAFLVGILIGPLSNTEIVKFIAIEFVIGFVGTALTWNHTRVLRDRLAAAVALSKKARPA